MTTLVPHGGRDGDEGAWPPHVRVARGQRLVPGDPVVLVTLPWCGGALFHSVPCGGAACGADLKDAIAREWNLPKLKWKHLDIRLLPGMPTERDVAILDTMHRTYAVPEGFFPQRITDNDPFPDPSRALGPGSFLVGAIEPDWSWRVSAADLACWFGLPVYEPYCGRRYGAS